MNKFCILLMSVGNVGVCIQKVINLYLSYIRSTHEVFCRILSFSVTGY